MISIDGVNASICMYGLSKDVKPTAAAGQTKVPNGAMFFCIDTQNVYMYDRENDKWYEI